MFTRPIINVVALKKVNTMYFNVIIVAKRKYSFTQKWQMIAFSWNIWILKNISCLFWQQCKICTNVTIIEAFICRLATDDGSASFHMWREYTLLLYSKTSLHIIQSTILPAILEPVQATQFYINQVIARLTCQSTLPKRENMGEDAVHRQRSNNLGGDEVPNLDYW